MKERDASVELEVEDRGDLDELLTRVRRATHVPLSSWFARGVKHLSHRTGLNTIVQRFSADAAVVLFYHKVQRRSVGLWGEPVLDVVRFERHLQYLSRTFEPVALSSVVDAIETGRRLPPHAVSLTFDDGYRNNLLLAAPLLKRYGIPATLFLSTGLIGSSTSHWAFELEEMFLRHAPQVIAKAAHNRALAHLCAQPLPRELLLNACVAYLKALPHRELLRIIENLRTALPVEVDDEQRFLSWDEVRELTIYGFELGGHTVTHPILTRLSLAEVEREVAECRVGLEDHLGVRPTLFAYPNGDSSVETAQIVGRYFRAGVTTQPGACTRTSSLLQLPRVGAPVKVESLAFEITRHLVDLTGTDLGGWQAQPGVPIDRRLNDDSAVSR